MIYNVVYAAQIVLLVVTIGMVIRSRRALNGLTRGLVLLATLLIVRRFDDMFGILDGVGTLVLSSVVVVVFALDVWKIDSMRDLYAGWHQARQEKMQQLEQMREQSGDPNWGEHQRSFAKLTQNITRKRRTG